jgi:uncharacterized protein YdhG (YjbR/CyaY superfamily)
MTVADDAAAAPAAAAPATAAAPTTVDAYIAGFPAEVRDVLQRVRAAVHAGVRVAAATDAPDAPDAPGAPGAPGESSDAEEKIRYGIAAVMLGGRYAIHFAGWKKHVGLYPVPRFEGELEAEVAPFRSAKDSVNFPYRTPIDYDLITRMAAEIVRMRRAE